MNEGIKPQMVNTDSAWHILQEPDLFACQQVSSLQGTSQMLAKHELFSLKLKITKQKRMIRSDC